MRRLMEITEEMLNAAMKKAIEAGLVPRRSTTGDMATYRDVLYRIVQAALAATQSDSDVNIALNAQAITKQHHRAEQSGV
jgi:hypothetical protein